MKSRHTGCAQETAAAKADLSIRTGRRIEAGDRQIKKERHWRTRKDPLKAVWESVLVPLLEHEPTLIHSGQTPYREYPTPGSASSR